MIAFGCLDIYLSKCCLAILHCCLGIAILASANGEFHGSVNIKSHLKIVETVVVTAWLTLEFCHAFGSSRQLSAFYKVKLKVLEGAGYIFGELHLAEHTFRRSFAADIHARNSLVEVDNNFLRTICHIRSGNQISLLGCTVNHGAMIDIHLEIIRVPTSADHELQLTGHGSLLEVSIARRVELYAMETEFCAGSIVHVSSIIKSIVRTLGWNVCIGVVPKQIVFTCINDE